ncbi:MAG TPA: DUF1667 domain-containing protein [Candidatus Omnitrophota bacterium]|nr:DUF1667 domain-containing protein [Candidatus Omnitrophota bacterium]
MIKKITCIECPQGCQLEVNVEEGKVIGLSGNKCPKGDAYGRQEVENPLRVLSSTVIAAGLEIKMVPVRTDKPIPKRQLFAAMEEIKKIVLARPVRTGDVIAANILGSGANLVATRDAGLSTDI